MGKESTLNSPKSDQVTNVSAHTGYNPIVLAFRIEKIEAELKKFGNHTKEIEAS